MKKEFAVLGLAVASLSLLCSPRPARARGDWTFLPEKNLFQPLLADPRETLVGLALRDDGQYEGEVGLARDLVAYHPQGRAAWSWGAFGGAFFLEKGDFLSLAGRQQALDWQAGTYLSESFGDFSNQVRWTHIKSTLGDGLEGVRQPIFYSRDRISLTSSWTPWDWLRLYGRFGSKLWWDDLRLGGSQVSLACGWEARTKPGLLAGTLLSAYAAFFLEYKDDGPGLATREWQAGLELPSSVPGGAALRLAATYYDGYSPFGQFYLQRDRHWALALEYEP